MGTIPAEIHDDRDAENIRARMIATWKLVSTEQPWADGSRRPYTEAGPNGKVYLIYIYTADGQLCASGMNPRATRME